MEMLAKLTLLGATAEKCNNVGMAAELLHDFEFSNQILLFSLGSTFFDCFDGH